EDREKRELQILRITMSAFLLHRDWLLTPVRLQPTKQQVKERNLRNFTFISCEHSKQKTKQPSLTHASSPFSFAL
ncbi:MAG TPA: hypothetical protein VFL47_15015, partial [Flavisolibacter sp.]|nr:hypothetical protein [Flavisolibacter sp.]